MAKARKRETEDDLLKDLLTEMKKSFPHDQKTITKPELDKKVAQEKPKKSVRLLASSSKKIPTAPEKRKPVESGEVTSSKEVSGVASVKGEVILLETNVDKLFDLVKSNGRVTFRQASSLFKVPQDLVEEWANILEEHKLVRVHYPAFGDGTMYMIEPIAKKSSEEESDKKSKKPTTDEKPKKGKKSVNNKKIVINLAALGALAVVLLWRFGPPELLDQPILLGGVGTIVVMLILLITVRKRRKAHGR